MGPGGERGGGVVEGGWYLLCKHSVFAIAAQVSALRGRYPALDIEVDGGLSSNTIDIAAQVSPFAVHSQSVA